MNSLASLTILTRLLQKEAVPFVVVGGVALDALRGNPTRPHDDIDLLIEHADMLHVQGVAQDIGARCVPHNGRYQFITDDFCADIWPLRKEEDLMVFYGHKGVLRFPSELYAKKQYASVNGMSVPIAANELLRFNSQFSDYPADRDFGASLGIVPDLYAGIMEKSE